MDRRWKESLRQVYVQQIEYTLFARVSLSYE
jgi:hypothetical protein